MLPIHVALGVTRPFPESTFAPSNGKHIQPSSIFVTLIKKAWAGTPQPCAPFPQSAAQCGLLPHVRCS